MVDPVVAERLHQRRGDVRLADEVGEPLRAVAAVESLRHVRTLTGGPTNSTGCTQPRKGPPAHPLEPAYPCCLPALGEFGEMTPHEGPINSLRRATAAFGRIKRPQVASAAEDSPSGLWRTLGKRVGGNPSRVRIPHPPPQPETLTCTRR